VTSATTKTKIDPPDEGRRSTRQWIVDWLNRFQFILYTFLVLCFLTLGYLWQRMFIVIPPGNEGVMYRTLDGGTVTNRTWGEGLHVIPPWDKLYVYDLRLQQKTLDFKVLSDEGLELGVQVVVQYRPYEEMLGFLQQDIGSDYFESLIRPEIESHIRRTFGGRPAHEIYASMRDVLQEAGQFPIIGKLDKSGNASKTRPYVYVQELKLTQIDLPALIEAAIAEKYHQEQLMLAYRYRLEREEKEADRKRTEAAGIRDFNLIAGKVSPDMLRWRSIDAALDLAKSNNSKVIVLGGGQPGLAMQLNLGDSPGATPPATESPPPSTPGPQPAVTAPPTPRVTVAVPPAPPAPAVTVPPAPVPVPAVTVPPQR
jgi:regulator of protease activity HflC (stomatin/prohibitin superfamily)